MSDFNYGDVHYIEKFDTCGAEEHPDRPAVIVSNKIWIRNIPTVQVVYLTTQPREDLPTHVVIHSTGRKSTVLCEQISTVDASRIKNYLCTVTPGELIQIERALFASIGFQYIKLPEGASHAFVADKTQRETLAQNSFLQQDLEDLQNQYDKLQEAYEAQQAKMQRMNEELIRTRTSSKIYERFYSDFMGAKQMNLQTGEGRE